MSRLLRRAAVAEMSAFLFLQVAMGGVVSGQVPGQLTNVGGNKTSQSCSVSSSELGLNSPGPPTNGIASTVLRDSPGMKGIAADLRGGLYVAYGNYILDQTKIVAGRSPALREEVTFVEKTPGLQTVFSNIVGIAVPPTGGDSLWVLQSANPGAQDPPPGVVFHVDLRGDRPVTTFARTGPWPTAIAADRSGNVYVTESSGAVYMLDPRGQSRTLLAPVTGANGIAVDLYGDVYVSGVGAVYRVRGGSTEIVADSATQHAGQGSAVMKPSGLAIGYEQGAQGLPLARYLYVADETTATAGRVLQVDLTANPRRMRTVAGGGSAFVKDTTTEAENASLDVQYLAADINGVYITSSDQCTIFHLTTPPAFRLPAEVTNPPGGSTNNTLPPDSGRTSDNESPAPDPAPSQSGNPQVDPGTGGQPASQGTQTQIVPGNQTQVQPQPPTELRVLDPGNAVTSPDPAAQPTVEPVPTPGTVPQFTPTPVQAPTVGQAPTVVQAPTPDAGTVTVADPGTSSAGVTADAAPAAPAAPAVAPMPAAPESAPPPAATEPVSNVGLAHGDSAVPARGATRYAMVRNDEDQSLAAALAIAGASAVVAVFLCAMFVAPGASSKPKPRPKGAY